MNRTKSQISNRPFDPTQDFDEYVGGDAGAIAGITQDHTRQPGEDIELSEEFETTDEGMTRKD